MEDQGYYTLRGYDRMEKPEISASMEDYLEMITRLSRQREYVRINQLAGLLNVTPPSASKMAGKLKEHGLVEFEPYGIIQLTAQGKALGAYLLHRHDILNRFLCTVNNTTDELELVEKIEHFVDRRTLENLEQWLCRNEKKQP